MYWIIKSHPVILYMTYLLMWFYSSVFPIIILANVQHKSHTAAASMYIHYMQQLENKQNKTQDLKKRI